MLIDRVTRSSYKLNKKNVFNSPVKKEILKTPKPNRNSKVSKSQELASVGK